MKKKLILSITLITLFGFSFLSSPVSTNEIGNTQASVKPRAYIGWVVKYSTNIKQEAPSLHRYEYGNISVRNGYAENRYTHLGTTSRSTWFTLEHKFSQNYRFW
ncbi:hypothetical protein [Carnobacterium maltaromaticum]|uniref:hypothetical protein n=1 Tax=Carnobacterium maltaromaticum TaxID=2751 RepID=UPI0039BE243E